MKKLIKSMGHAVNGIQFAATHERNFRIHMMAFGVVVLFGLVFNLSGLEWALILLCVGMVHTTEIINTALEKSWDYLEPEHHPVAKVVKDLMAGAVLFSAAISLIIGAIIFFPKIF